MFSAGDNPGDKLLVVLNHQNDQQIMIQLMNRHFPPLNYTMVECNLNRKYFLSVLANVILDPRPMRVGPFF